MPNGTLAPAQEQELNGLVAAMEADNLSSEEITDVVDNYISENSKESYEPETPIFEIDESRGIQGPENKEVPEPVREDPDPLADYFLEATKLTPEEQEEAVQTATNQKTELFDSFNGAKGNDVYAILGSDDKYREYLEYLDTGEVTPSELDVAKVSGSVTDFKERQLLSSLSPKDKAKYEEISNQAKANLKIDEKRLSKYAPIVEQKSAVLEPLHKQMENLRISIDRKIFDGEDSTKERKAYSDLAKKVNEESKGFEALLGEYLDANKNTLDDAQIADAFSRTYDLMKRIGQPFEELETDLQLLAVEGASALGSLLDGVKDKEGKTYKAPGESYAGIKEQLLDEREEEDIFRANNLPKPVELGDIKSIAAFATYASDAIINNAPSLTISAAGSFIPGGQYLAYPLFFGLGASAKLSEHELIKKGAGEELKRINTLLEGTTDRDQIVALERQKYNIENALTLPEWRKWLTVAGHGTAELVFEKFGTMKIFDNIKDAAKIANKVDLKKGFKATSKAWANKAYGKVQPFVEGFTREALTEGATTLGQNWFDINVLGERKSLDEGLSDSILQGGIIGGALGGGGSISSSIVNAVANDQMKAKIAKSSAKISSYLQQITENENLTPSELSGLIENITTEARGIANLEPEILFRLNELTPSEQRKVFEKQAEIDALRYQITEIEDSNVSDEVKETQIEKVNTRLKQLSSDKLELIDRRLSLLEHQQLEDLDTPVSDVSLDDIKDKLNKRDGLLKNDLATLEKQLDAAQVGDVKRVEETEPLRKLLKENKRFLDNIQKHEEKELEKVISGSKDVGEKASKEEVAAEARRVEKERVERQKHTVKFDKNGRVKEVSDPEGNLASPATAQKRIIESLPSIDLVSGKTLANKGFFPQKPEDVTDLVLDESENPLEIAEELDYEQSKDPTTSKGYIEEAITEDVRITKEDYAHYGDPNLVKDISRSWFDPNAAPLDTRVRELSEELGVEVTPQDVIDTINDNPGNPNEYIRKTPLSVTQLKIKFQELTGINPTPSNLKAVLKEGRKQRESRPELDETTKEALGREAAERKEAFEQALKEVNKEETSETPVKHDPDKISRAKIKLESVSEIKQARADLKKSVVDKIKNKKIEADLVDGNYITDDVRTAHTIRGGANKRGLDAIFTTGEGGTFLIEILDPTIEKKSTLDNIIDNLEDKYNNMDNDGTLYSSIVPIPSSKAVLGLIVDALKLFRKLIRAGVALQDALVDSYLGLKGHISYDQWAAYVNKNVAPKELKRLKLEADELAFYFNDTLNSDIEADLEGISKKEYKSAKEVEIVTPEEFFEDQKKALENVSPTVYNDVLNKYMDNLSSIKIPAVKQALSTIEVGENLSEEEADIERAQKALYAFGVALTGANVFNIEDVLQDKEDTGLGKSAVDFHVRLGSILVPDPKNVDGSSMTDGDRNKFYVSLSHVFLDIAEGLDIVGYDIGFHTNGTYQVKVIDPLNLDMFTLHATGATRLTPEQYGLNTPGNETNWTKFRQGGHNFVSNASPEVEQYYKKKTEENKEAFEALSNSNKVQSVMNLKVGSILLNPAYQKSDLFTYPNHTAEERTRKQLEDKVMFGIMVDQGINPYTVNHTYALQFRQTARSLGFNYQSNKKARALEKRVQEGPLGTNGWAMLNILTADAFGAEFTTPEDRYRYSVNNRSKFLKVYNNPFSPESVALVNKAKEPVKFLAYVMEIGEALSSGDPTTFVSSLPLYLDFNSSVNQHLALALNNSSLARISNLSNTTEAFDPYVEGGVGAVEGLVKSDLPAKVMDDAVKEVNRLKAVKDKRKAELDKAKAAYLRRKNSEDSDRKLFSRIKKEMGKGDKDVRSWRKSSGNPKPDSGIVIAKKYIESELTPSNVKEILSKIVTANSAYNTANSALGSFRSRKASKQTLEEAFQTYFSDPARIADIRTPAKIANMIRNYGAGKARVTQDIYDELRTSSLYPNITYYHAQWLTDRMFKSIEQTFEELEDLRKFYKLVGKESAEFTTPVTLKGGVLNGLIVINPRYSVSKPVGLTYNHGNPNVLEQAKTEKSGKTRIFPKAATEFGKMNKRKMETNVGAIITHGQDAASPAYTFLKDTYDSRYVHDDGSAIGQHVAELMLDQRRSLVENYKGRNLPKEIVDQNPHLDEAKHFYEQILKNKRGDFNIDDVMFAPYASGAGKSYIRVAEAGVESKTDQELAQDFLDTLSIEEGNKLSQLSEVIESSDISEEKIADKINKITGQLDLFGNYQQSTKEC